MGISAQNEAITEKKAAPNRLIKEKSPYLLQHARNPVDWFPWGDEAFGKAKAEDKPIFLSIGYSTCHWCHVMEAESFEDPEVAALMNDTFVSIKVDREERPDIDAIYMAVCQMLTGSGGWPMTIVMTPDKKPFFAGTYFPKHSVAGRIGIMDLILKIKDVYKTRRAEVIDSAEKIADTLREAPAKFSGAGLDEKTLQTAYEQLSARFDEAQAGFGNAPKFPTPHNLLFLLRYWKRTGSERALWMVERTLKAMRQGGIYDQVGFGFHRYSTDRDWLVPHFEKMLYDQALITIAYVEAYLATGKDEYRNTAKEILDYVLRDMRSPEGAFYSAEDADSEGVEGKFYVWSKKEIVEILGKEESELFCNIFDVSDEGNYAEEATGEKTGKNILRLKKNIEDYEGELDVSADALRHKIGEDLKRLFEAREKRVRPFKDDKALTDWNGLMIAALAIAGRAFDNEKYTLAAEQALEFIRRRLRKDDGSLMHRYRDGESAIEGNLDDYAFLAWGLIELYETTFKTEYLRSAIELTEYAIAHFWDKQNAGFYFTADNAGDNPAFGGARPKEIYDGAAPSGNSVLALNLSRIGRITEATRYEQLSEAIGRAFTKAVAGAPSAYAFLMCALEFAIGKKYEVVIAGKTGAPDTACMLRTLASLYEPGMVVLFKPDDETDPEITKLAKYTKGHIAIEGKATAYVCNNFECELPTTDVKQMKKGITH